MAKFLAMTSKGLVDALDQELQNLDLKTLSKTPSGVVFESNWAGCYKANLMLRTATRVVLPVLDFPAYKPEELYHNVRKHDFTKYIDPKQTMAVQASVRDSVFRDQRFVALKIKDAIVDQFREKYGVRPDVDSDEPDLLIHARVVKNEVSLAVDTSGRSLAQRGYRKQTTQAPLREHLAAALLEMTGWTPDLPLVDPMCGSGTILIEAALKGQKTPPGSLRGSFAFQRFSAFQEEAWESVLSEALDQEDEDAELSLFGFDISSQALDAAKTNARKAQVADLIEFNRKNIQDLEPPTEKPGIVIINPPYGERLGGDLFDLKDLYWALGKTLKERFRGWTCWILSGHEELTPELKLKSTRRIPVYNGPIECRFLEYQIR